MLSCGGSEGAILFKRWECCKCGALFGCSDLGNFYLSSESKSLKNVRILIKIAFGELSLE